MKDEEYLFMKDSLEKKDIARSSFKKVSGRRGRVRLPSDYKTKKELMNMNGECKSYRLNQPMTWKEFLELPADIQVMYITGLRNRYKVPNKELAEMFGTSVDNLWLKSKKLGIPSKAKSKQKWDKEGFYAWWKGIPVACDFTETVKKDADTEEIPLETDDMTEDIYLDEWFMSHFIPADQHDFFKANYIPLSKYEEVVRRLQNEVADLEKKNFEMEDAFCTLEKMFASGKEKEVHFDELYRENEKMKAQLEIVHLIFGGKLNANIS